LVINKPTVGENKAWIELNWNKKKIEHIFGGERGEGTNRPLKRISAHGSWFAQQSLFLYVLLEQGGWERKRDGIKIWVIKLVALSEEKNRKNYYLLYAAMLCHIAWGLLENDYVRLLSIVLFVLWLYMAFLSANIVCVCM